MKNYIALLLAAVAAFLFSACQTTSTGATEPNWELINTASRISFKWATKAVLDKNPSYTDQVSAINSSVAVLFAGEPSELGLRDKILALAPELQPVDVLAYASALMDAYRAYVAATGRTQIITTDPRVATLISSITTGIGEGVTLHLSSHP